MHDEVRKSAGTQGLTLARHRTTRIDFVSRPRCATTSSSHVFDGAKPRSFDARARCELFARSSSREKSSEIAGKARAFAADVPRDVVDGRRFDAH
jgi:hypothetical protein